MNREALEMTFHRLLAETFLNGNTELCSWKPERQLGKAFVGYQENQGDFLTGVLFYGAGEQPVTSQCSTGQCALNIAARCSQAVADRADRMVYFSSSLIEITKGGL